MASAARMAGAVTLMAVAGVGMAFYPLWPGALAAVVALYAVALWHWPWAWLLVLPAALPNLDFAPWTGWLLVQEPDFLLLVTLAVLLLRAPPAQEDLRVEGLGGLVLSLVVIAGALSVVIGLLVPDVAGGSSIVYLTEQNTWRTAKPLVSALALLPFLRARERTHGDGLALLGGGMLLGLTGVVVLVGVERSVFVSLWDFRSDYRVAAAFASMHVGGGHIGTFLAMALPFLVVPLLRCRARWWPLVALLAAGGGYALVVTFARTAYAAALVAVGVTLAALALAGFQRSQALLRDVLVPVAMLAGLAAAVLAAAGGTFMSARLASSGADLSVREANWSRGLAVRDDGWRALLFGSGLGTYPRLSFDRVAPLTGPSNIRVGMERAAPMVTLQGRQPLYLVQKTGAAQGQPLRLAFRARAHGTGAQLTVGLCGKWLLYSLDCTSASHRVTAPGVWEDVAIPIAAPVIPGHPLVPIEFFVSAAPSAEMDLASLRLIDSAGANLLRNGDFAAGGTFWFFTDDHHVLWRIFNQYLTSFFEGGILGILAYVLLLAGGFTAGLRALSRGNRLGAPFAGALAAFAVASLFDAPLEAPRLALLLYLVAFAPLSLWRTSEHRLWIVSRETPTKSITETKKRN